MQVEKRQHSSSAHMFVRKAYREVKTGICSLLTLASLIASPADVTVPPMEIMSRPTMPISGSILDLDPPNGVRIPVSEVDWPPGAGRFQHTLCNVFQVSPNIAITNAHCPVGRGEKVVFGGPGYDGKNNTTHHVTSVFYDINKFGPKCQSGSMNVDGCVDIKAMRFFPPTRITTITDLDATHPVKNGDVVVRKGYSPPRGSPGDETKFKVASLGVANNAMQVLLPLIGLSPTFGQSGTPIRNGKGEVVGLATEMTQINAQTTAMVMTRFDRKAVKATIDAFLLNFSRMG